MSTGYECMIVELKPKQWYYVLQRGSCPVGAWDWTEHADIIGPYASCEAAIQGLSDNEANPGGWSEIDHDSMRPERREELLKRARKPYSAYRW